MKKTFCFALLVTLSSVVLPSAAQTTSPEKVLQDVFTYINQARSKSCQCGNKRYPAVAPLAYNEKLTAAAQQHANWMASVQKLSHTQPKRDVANSWDRINREGYRWSLVEENIAAGQMTAREVVDGWIKSPGHCKNLMDGSVKEIGIGLAYTTSGKYHYYWVTDFATPR
ncbi:CAP domain-containing protein [Spirosoma validum]|uniref:CAP domain-containing protein n=1 Tax=Spirosoma validum TaxID=2771355 RepID=A0A927GFC2_9BACT|nr:CAP domain-containing protein [Spirosoma validum]MBD2755455.1 CAP domain-containing protein [Spirosoma validum]